MAKKDKDKKSGKQTLGWFGRLKQRVMRTLLILAAFIAGLVIGNVDRLGNGGVEVLQYKRFIPSVLHGFLPGGTAKFVTGSPKDELNGKIIEVYDGDTAILLNSSENKKYKIRFYGIDAPEAAQKYGIESRDALRKKILGKEVRIVIASTDRYGRCVGKVYRDDRYINLEMVQEGNAWHYRAYARKEREFASAQRKAREQELGLWQEEAPEPPWEYRSAKK